MKLLGVITVLGFVIIQTSCSSVKVSSDYDPSQDFSSYKTYKWYDGEPNPNDALAKNQLAQRRVFTAVDSNLQLKGFTKVTSDDADFIVNAHAGVAEKMRVDNYGYRGYGWYDPWWGPYGGYTSVSYYDEGSLVIDVVDSKEKELSWRGIGTATLKDHSSVEDAVYFINDVVSRIMVGFPPGQGNK